ncbi:MAG: YdcF family protein [Paracoccaceae bacterium]
MGFIRWIFALTVLSGWCALIGTALYIALYKPAEEPVTGDIIIVLGGDGASTGTLNAQTAERVSTGVALFEAEAGTQLVMTGGEGVAEAMRDMAVQAGVPSEAILVEGASKSTLQNALFTADLDGIDTEASVLLVTQKYHLPRAHASFRWAGFGNVTNVPANPDAALAFNKDLLWEAVKWPLNALRAAAASAANAGGVPRENYIQYLE